MLSRCFSILIIVFSSVVAQAQVFKIDTSHKAQFIVDEYLLNDNGIAVNNIQYKGLINTLGLFYYKSNYQLLSPYGIILSTGDVIAALGPNNEVSSHENYTPGDRSLEKIANAKTFDAAILEFDFMSLTDSISFTFQFASEEYPNYVEKGVSDIFGFLVKDYSTGTAQNIGTISKNGVPIAIDMIHKDQNADLYIPNNYSEFKYYNNISEEQLSETLELFQFNGFSRSIQSGIKLEPYKKYHFKIAIADVGDRKFDSWIFIYGNSLASNGEIINPDFSLLNDYFHFQKLDSIEIKQEQENIKFIVPVYFDYNSFTIPKATEEYLDYLKNLLVFSNYFVTINGYADSKGTDEYNLELSQKRADEIKDYLVKQGIDSNRIRTKGKGEITEESDFKSRKVEFILSK